MAFEKAQWIWLQDPVSQTNEYADFSAVFTAERLSDIFVRICSKSEYALYVNGWFVGFQQFGDFPDEKAYDEYALSAFVHEGENLLCVVALSRNYNTCSHIENGKGIIFEVVDKNGELLVSDENTLSRSSTTYRSGALHPITSQLGMSFYYDCNGDESWLQEGQMDGKNGFARSAVSDRKTKFKKRPVPRLLIEKKLPFKDIGNGIFDAGKECVGQLYFEIESDREKELDIYYGEHITDGGVRHTIGGREFTLHFRLKKGKNLFVGWFLRLGGRYLQLSDVSVQVREIGMIPVRYPVERLPYTGKAIPKEIYDTAVYTLECCMHDHYEDCPWREQGQYTMDSRTQILCGYYAFGETRLPASALRTMAHRLTEQGVFSITSPSKNELSIPSFSLIYPLMLKEYYDFTEDKALLSDVYENTRRMLEHYLSARVDGLLPMLKEWNFFEWADDLHNEWEIGTQTENREKLPLATNAFLIIALENFALVSEILGLDGEKYRAEAALVRKKAHDAFYCTQNGLFYSYCVNGRGEGMSEYCQVFALYAGIAEKKEEKAVLDVLMSDNALTPLTLNNYIFKYEVLLQRNGYERFVCEDVRRVWGYMLEQGATTFWETIKGEADFCGAGSLCHGWSAVPVYVARKLEEKEK